MVTLRNLEIFEKVAACGKMSAAARELYISQSAVSQAIVEIERTYHVLLFDRIGKKLYLTATGEELLRHAREVLRCQASTEEFLSAASSHKKLRIGATLTIGSTLLWPLLAQLKAGDPGLVTEVDVENTHFLAEKLLRGGLDIALVEGDVKSGDLLVQPSIADELVLVCGRDHPFFGRESVSLSMLEGQRFVLREEGSGTRAQLVEPLRHAGISYEVPCTCCNVESLREAVLHGQGISYLSRRLVQKECAAGLLWACAIRELDGARTFDVVWHRRKVVNDAMRRFIALCAAWEKDAAPPAEGSEETPED